MACDDSISQPDRVVEQAGNVQIVEVDFPAFWTTSRYARMVDGHSLEGLMKQHLDLVRLMGGFYHFLECRIFGEFAGSLMVFWDRLYRSRRRENVACFGLVTVEDASVLENLLRVAVDMVRKSGMIALRGPVNPPRSLFGYGVQAWGFDLPAVAGSSSNSPEHASFFKELSSRGFFSGRDVYYNFSQDPDKTRELVQRRSTMGKPLYRDFEIVHPDFENPGNFPEMVARMMNESLEYRPDFCRTTPQILMATALQFASIPHGERMLAFFMKNGELLAGVIEQPDWFQIIREEPLTHLVGDIFMVSKKYRGLGLSMNCFEYTASNLEFFNPSYFEHASAWTGTTRILRSVKHGLVRIVKGFFVYEIKC